MNNSPPRQILFFDTFTQPHYTRYHRKQRTPLTILKGKAVLYSANRQQSLTDIVWVCSICKQVQQLEISSIRPFSKLDRKKTKEIPCNAVTANTTPVGNFSRESFKST